jgi:hypothetical protein
VINFQLTCFDTGRSFLKSCPDMNNILLVSLGLKLADSFSRNRRKAGQLDSPNSGDSPMVGFCEHNNELSCSIKAKDYFNQLVNYKLFRKNLAPWNLLLNYNDFHTKH